MLIGMSDEQARWARVKEIVGLALETGPAERRRLIIQACAGDAALQQEVESLLQHSGETARLERYLADAVNSAISEHTTAPVAIGPYRIERALGAGGMGT